MTAPRTSRRRRSALHGRSARNALRGLAPLGLGLLLSACGGPRAPEPPRSSPGLDPAPLDEFEVAGAWTAAGSDGVSASARQVPGLAGDALRLDYDFQGHGGHVGVRRALPLRLPDNYELSFYVRGEGPPNDLQFKLLDGSGDNVWWYRQRAFQVSPTWQQVTFKKRQVEFAWGPTQDRQLAGAEGLEVVLAAGQGGRGWLELDRLALRELPEPPAVPPPPVASASSRPELAALALDGRADTVWRSAPDAAGATFDLDLGYAREFGGLVLRWGDAPALRYDVALSRDGSTWSTVRRVTQGNGGRDALMLPESEARYVRLALHAGPSAGYALAELEVKELAFGATPNAFIGALAREAPRGRYPRGFSEQAYWTLVGVDEGSDSGLLSEDGALEVGLGRFSVEPFVRVGDELVTWADVEIEPTLRDGYLPVPSVVWRRPGWTLRVTAFASGDRARAELVGRYELTNASSRPLSLELLLAVRPLQVNPPTQWLNQMGGHTPIRQLEWAPGLLSVNGAPALWALVPPARVTLAPFDAADFPERLGAASSAPVDDPVGMASGVLAYPATLAPGESLRLGVVAPLGGGGAPSLQELEGVQAAEDAVAARWHEALDRVELTVPAEGQPLIDTLRSSLAHLLMSRDGPMLRPGTRSYARSWIRDGAMMSEALLRMGHEQAAERYFDWYAPYQFDSGKVPCCVDARGADPVPEHDSPGELIFLAAELHRYTGDRAALERRWPRVARAAAYMESLRQSERTARNQTPERRHLYGLLPPSISHEGYSDKPAYSYWDDFWGLIGYQDAAWLAEVLGERTASETLARARDEFSHDLHASLRASAARHGVSFLPGAADRGDFDATSTTIALAPGREQATLPRELLLGTFERYWQDFTARRSGGKDWDAYTPYELRVAGTFIRLGWRERARVLFDYFMADRRPAAWNQWAEVVGREPREPRFIGDMPHAWISSDYMRAVLDLFAYARPADKALVLAAGVPASWLGEGVSVRGLRTVYGVVDFTLGRSGREVTLTVAGPAPPGGFVLPWLWPGTPADAAVTIDGEPARWVGGELVIHRARARVRIDLPDRARARGPAPN